MILKELRKKAKLTQEKLATKVGVSRSTIAMYESGASQPDLQMITKLAEILGVSVDFLLGNSKKNTLRILGKIPAGIPCKIPAGIPFEAIEDIEGYIDINPKFADQSEYFALRVKGDSMSPRILDGDVVVVKKQDDADTGDVCVVMVNGYDATLKTIKKEESGIFLIPTNQAYETKFYSNADIQSLPVRIIGKVVELRGNI